MARFDSHATIVGLAGGRFEFAFGALPLESELTITYWGSALELIEVLELARAGRIRAHVQRFPQDPRSTLLADPDTKDWHEFAMEWKEHVAWIAPLLATAALPR